MEREIQLGDRVRYRINRFEGIVTGITDYLFQCKQLWVVPEMLDKDGKQQEGHWYDAPWCDLVKAGVHAPQAAVEAGGRRLSGAPDRPHPPGRP